MSGTGRPFTTGWRVAIVLALLAALGNSGVNALRDREERRYLNHERRIDDLENRVRDLQSSLDEMKRNAPEQGR